MENTTSFNDAVHLLSTQDLIAPVYFILAGVNPDEGAVITRNQNTLIDIWMINKTSTDFNKWFLLETNYDHWQPPPSKDDRRTPGINAMNLLTQSRIDFYSLMGVLTLKPVCNKYVLIYFLNVNHSTHFWSNHLKAFCISVCMLLILNRKIFSFLSKVTQCIQLSCQLIKITKMDLKY